MKTYECLIDDAAKLDEVASKIQLEESLGLSQKEINEFIETYHFWFAECLSILPDDLKEKFRSEYEGNWYSSKIKRFLEGPEEINPLYAHVEKGKPNPFPYWQYPYRSTFFAPIRAQKQMLIEACRREPQQHIPYKAITTIDRLARNFHLIVHQLSQRYDNRPPLTIGDEYDVQDLFHAMLIPFFEDIRAEEGVPSHAGKNTRIDFLLKREQIVVEIKKTREGLTGKKIGEELTIDKNYYRSHPDCKAFIAFVYDPEKRITNPKGLEDDLSQTSDGMFVKVIINQG